MSLKTKLTAALTAVTLLSTAQAHADDGFTALAGIAAEPLNAQEMDAVQGKSILGGPCVSEICGGAGGFFGNSLFSGQWVVGPSSSGAVIQDALNTYPNYFQQLYPGFPASSGGMAEIDAYLNSTLGATLGIFGLGF